MRLAVVQTRDIPTEVPARAAHCLGTLQVCAAAGAELVVFPELYLGGYLLDRELARKAEQAELQLGRLQAAADELGLSALIGLPRQVGAALLNSVAIIRPGAAPEFYDKTHLFQVEKQWFAPGQTLWHGELAGWPAGIVVCYELAFPEISRVLALRGARLLLGPAAFAARREHVWRLATASRALENGCYLAAAGNAGLGTGGQHLGQSRIVDPRGGVVAEAGRGDEILYADLSAELVDEVRAGDGGGHTYFVDRRPSLYGEISRTKE